MSAAAKDQVHLAFGCDRNVADGLAAVIASAAHHLSKDRQLRVHVLDCGLGESMRAKLRTMVADKLPRAQIEFVEVLADRMKDFPQPFLTHVSHATYARLFLHELLPSIDRVIYLDCDLLIRGDLTELYELDLAGCALAAVQDKVITSFSHELDTLAADLPAIDPRSPYFNAGVLLLDLQRLRSIDATALYAKAFRQVKAKQADQSILNMVCHGRWKKLPTRWNRQILLGSGYNMFANEKGGIWHFTSRIKPWQVRRRGARGLLAQWYRELDRVGWVATAVPQTEVHVSWLRDFIKAAQCWIRSQLRGSQRG